MNRTNQRVGRGESGSAMIELIVSAPVVAIVLGIGFYLIYLSFAKIWITRAAREASVCLVTPMNERRCRQRLESTLRIALPMGETEITEFRLGPARSHVEITMRFSPGFVEPGLITASNSVQRAD